jgi:hypothetical protein
MRMKRNLRKRLSYQRKLCLARVKRETLILGLKRAHLRIVGRLLRIKRIMAGSGRLAWMMMKRTRLRLRGELLNNNNSRGWNLRLEKLDVNKCKHK